MTPTHKQALIMTLKKQWFDMIKSGVKTEEYREIKPYWDSRLSKHYTHIHFKNGYGKVPEFLIELLGVSKGIGRPEWGAPEHEVYILKLGKVYG